MRMLYYLKMCRRYVSMFMSKTKTIEEKIADAGYVCTFLCLWRQWIRHEPAKTKAKNYITEEGFRDVLMSCHFFVLVTMHFKDKHPGVVVPYHLMGTDVCEDLFSMLGSWVMNRGRTVCLRQCKRCVPEFSWQSWSRRGKYWYLKSLEGKKILSTRRNMTPDGACFHRRCQTRTWHGNGKTEVKEKRG